jgi:prepilin-type N-terminal cleavage/methylation domain-containing protein
MARFRSSKRNGFTLVEVLASLVIVGILSAVALPRLDLEAYKVNSAVRSVTSTLTYAQRLAVTLQHDVRVSFDSTNGRLRIHEDANNNGIMDGTERVTSLPFDGGVSLGRASAPAAAFGTAAVNFTQMQAGIPVVVFRRDGTASENGGFYLTTTKSAVQNNPYRSRAGQIVRGSGRVIWQRYTTSGWQRGN